MKKKAVLFVVLLIITLVGGFGWLWTGVTEPEDVEEVAVNCSEQAPTYSLDKPLKVMSFNVQYMASKNYVFFYDLPNDAGPDTAPSLEHITWTLDEVARIIKAEDPDVILLQEMADGDVRSHYTSQLSLLLDRLGGLFPCHAATDYWRIRFMPHPRFLGPVGLQLATLSKYKMNASVRYQLPLMPMDFFSQKFYFRRAILETHLSVARPAENPIVAPRSLALLNTHLDAWGGGSGIMPKQIGLAMDVVMELGKQNTPWVMGGDFNLLPPDGGLQRDRIHGAGTGAFDTDTAIKPFYDKFNAVPALDQLIGDESQVAPWYTHFPNNPKVSGPDRTIDYLFSSSQLKVIESYIRQHDTLEISDHLPVVATYLYQQNF